MLRFVWLESLTQDYTDAEIGQIIRDLYNYAHDGIEPQQYADCGMRGLWRSMKDGVDKDFSKYRERSEKAAASANARWNRNTTRTNVKVVQSNADASSKMQTHSIICDDMHLHPTSTGTDTGIDTPTPAPPAAVAPHKGALGGMTALETSTTDRDSDTKEALERFINSIRPSWAAADAAPPDVEKREE